MDVFATESQCPSPLKQPARIPSYALLTRLTRTRHEPYTREGVLVLDLARWLLGEQGF